MRRTISRHTRSKEAVIQTLIQTTVPISLQQLHHQVIKYYPQTSFSTVFRIVRRLEYESKVVRVDRRERGSRYEWANRPHHHHIVCDDCGSVRDIDDTLLNFEDSRIEMTTGYQITGHVIELQGICYTCQNKAYGFVSP